MAGVARMPEWRFQAANIASAVIWAPLMLMPGYAASVGLAWLDLSDDPLLAGGVLLLVGGAAWVWWKRSGPPGSRRSAPPAKGRMPAPRVRR